MRWITLLFLTGSATAGTTQTITEQIYGRQVSAEEYAHQLVETSDGGFLTAGQTTAHSTGLYDAFIQKTTSSGQQEWLRRYGGAANDVAFSVDATPDGGYVFAGYTESEGKGRADGFVKKAAPDGTLEWTTLFGNTGWDQVTRVHRMAHGGYVVGGTAVYNREPNGQDVFWAILDAGGHILAQYVIPSPDLDELQEIIPSVDGNFLLLYRGGDCHCAKYNSAGQLIWDHVFNQFETGFFDHMVEGGDGRVYLSGLYYGQGNSIPGTVYCLGKNGGKNWVTSLDANTKTAAGLQFNPSNGLLEASFYRSRPTLQTDEVNIYSLSQAGSLQDTAHVVLPNAARFRDIRYAQAGSLIVLCDRNMFFNRQTDFGLTAYNDTGSSLALAWDQTYGETAPNESDFYLNSCKSTRNTFFSISNRYLSATENYGLWVLQTDIAGQVLSEIELPYENLYTVAPMKATPDGGCVFLSINNSGNYLVKIGADGQLAWARAIQSGQLGGLVDLDVLPDGGFAVFSGQSAPRPGQLPVLFRLDARGDSLWSKELSVETENRYLEQMITLPGGGFMLVGKVYQPDSFRYDLWCVFANAQGIVVRERVSELSGFFYANEHNSQLQCSADGGFLLLSNYYYEPAPNEHATGVILLKINAAGTIVWDHRLQELGGAANALFKSVEEVPCQGYVLSAIGQQAYDNLPGQYATEDELRILQWIDYSGAVRGFNILKTYPGPSTSDTAFIPGYTYFEWGGKYNPNFLDLYFWRVAFPAVDSAAVGAAAVEISPNPSGDAVCLGYTSGYTGPLQVQVFDAAGRLVDDFVEFKSSLAWIMRYNNPLPGGQYIIRLRAGDHYASGKWLKR